MVLPLLLVVVGQQVFRMAATAAAKKAIQAVGGRIVSQIPKKLAGKKVGSGAAFTKLVKEKKPALQDKIGNLFAKKPNRVTQKSPGRTNKAEGINVGTVRQAASKRGDKVVAAVGVGVPSALAIAKLRANLKKAKSEKARIQAQKDIDNAVAKVVVAEEKAKNNSATPKVSPRPKARKTPLRPKARPTK